MEKAEAIKKTEEVVIEEVINQEKTKKEMISVGVERGRKNSRYPEGGKPHY